MKLQPARPEIFIIHILRCTTIFLTPLIALMSMRPTSAALVEEILNVPVVVTTSGQTVSQPVIVTVFRDDARVKAPYLVLSHGRSSAQLKQHKGQRMRFAENAAYFVRLGFVVFVPTRIGYIPTGGPDIENSGTCRLSEYGTTTAAAADETMSIVDFVRTLSYVDQSHGLAVGQSVGGLTTIALSARDVAGLLGAVNFSGGKGGNKALVSINPDHPCHPEKLKDLYRTFGTANRIPTLWLYSANDHLWGATIPKEWFAAFSAAGGQGEFVELPVSKDNGHDIFTDNPAAWHPAFEKFVHQLGLDPYLDATPP